MCKIFAYKKSFFDLLLEFVTPSLTQGYFLNPGLISLLKQHLILGISSVTLIGQIKLDVIDLINMKIRTLPQGLKIKSWSDDVFLFGNLGTKSLDKNPE